RANCFTMRWLFMAAGYSRRRRTPQRRLSPPARAPRTVLREKTAPMAEASPAAATAETPTLDFERPVVALERKIEELVRVSGGASELRPQIALLEARARELQQKIFSELTPWKKVQLSRHPARPYTLDYIERLLEGFIELHGDRRFADDPAVVGGFGTFDGMPVLA